MKLSERLLFFILTIGSCGYSQLNHAAVLQAEQSSRNVAANTRTLSNLDRSIAIMDSAVYYYFDGSKEMKLSRFYNPFNGKKSKETGSVWMYTSAIEATNSILQALERNQRMRILPKKYEEKISYYKNLLQSLYDAIEYYAGSFTLTSYTQTKEWNVYAVDRAKEKGTANVTGVLNVYDDQEWLIRELIRSYMITRDSKYLENAEYLTSYVLDGWDCSLDDNGEERGGITWGPGYMTKHACSNAPIVAPLVWLYQIYKYKDDEISYRKIDNKNNRYEVTTTKADYYLTFAKKIYAWQKRYLQEPSGVYYDLIGAAAGEPQYETVNGIKYRKGVDLTRPAGRPYTYNTGTMLSGCAELYRATGNKEYADDVKSMSQAAFNYFAKKDKDVKGYYSYPVQGFSVWFNDVLLRGFLDARRNRVDVAEAIQSYQDNLDYAWNNYRRNGLLPTDLLVGWKNKKEENQLEAMFCFTYASEYAMLATFNNHNRKQ